MNLKSIIPDKSIDLFVKNIWIFEHDENKHTSLPFFADGYPGLIFHQSEQGLTVNPQNKKMPTLFLYGQTINPITLEISGAYKIIIFQFYPFVLKILFNILPRSIHDNCCDMTEIIENNFLNIDKILVNSSSLKEQVQAISNMIMWFAERKTKNIDTSVASAVKDITQSKGQLNIQLVVQKTGLNTRTFERRFLNETGLTAKQFAKIIQFQSSMTQLSSKDYSKLTDIVYQNGFADQSHFIRVFKVFTGKTPKYFKNK
ncbi:helix-turn-helix domain-containing protein [Sphingobacterium sp. SG20118]|uniref:helix-turn-helix domain-containing protein n=1 Tax=Sphingobacterium sp. SG20118 TaxID=3367156 RepID=UPI0037DFC5E2